MENAMQIAWIQKTSDSTVQASDDEQVFLKYWKEWNARFPERWKLVTLTGHPNSDDYYQLRLWCGEPHSFAPSHVDSMGHNLVVSIASMWRRELQHLVMLLLEGHKAERSTCDMVEVWRLDDGAG